MDMPAEPQGRRIDSYAAVLWDMDGTLVDTEPYWTIAELALADRYGGTWSAERSLEVVGFDLLDAAPPPAPGRWASTCAPEQIVDEMLDDVIAQVEREVPWRPGARELLASLSDAGVPCALVTMSYTRFVKPILEGLPAGDVRRGGHRRHRVPRQATSRAVPDRGPGARRTRD